jgi:hypothetical protein
VGPRAIPAEDELLLHLCGTRERRSAVADRIADLLRKIDYERLVERLREQRLLQLVGTRLHAFAPDLVPGRFRQIAEEEVERSRRDASLLSHLAREFSRTLQERGIEPVALKGPLLAERIYEDPGLRATPADLDLLVPCEQLDAAVELLTSDYGYTVHDPTRWANDLPHYHYGLTPSAPLLPKLELHWRVHWYEEEFAPELIGRSIQAGGGARVPAPADELAVLLAIYGRDGFVGLRMAADIATWWDRSGDQLPPEALQPLLERHPRLREVWTSALIKAEQVVGLPRSALVGQTSSPSPRVRRAARMGNWRAEGDEGRIATDVTAIDMVLTPAGAWRTTFRHYYAQPLGHYVRTYGWQEGARVRNELRRALHVCARLTKLPLRLGRRLWAVRGGRALHDALPCPSTASPVEPVSAIDHMQPTVSGPDA